MLKYSFSQSTFLKPEKIEAIQKQNYKLTYQLDNSLLSIPTIFSFFYIRFLVDFPKNYSRLNFSPIRCSLSDLIVFPKFFRPNCFMSRSLLLLAPSSYPVFISPCFFYHCSNNFVTFFLVFTTSILILLSFPNIFSYMF